MDQPSQLAQQALEHARRGDFEQALSAAKGALSDHPGDFGLTLFLGLLHARRAELGEAASWFAAAMALSPADPVPRLELARALIGLDRLDEAEQTLDGLTGLEPMRLSALLALRRRQHDAAATLYEQIVQSEPRDFESWGNLGLSRLAMGNAPAAVDALSRSLDLRPDQSRFREKWVEAHVAAGTGEEALKSAAESARNNPRDAGVLVTIARLETLLGRPDRSQAWLEQALEIDPRHAAALVALARVHERRNRIADLADVVGRIEALGEPVAELPLLIAELAYRRGDYDRAIDLARNLPPQLEPGARAQLIGQVAERLGDTAAAFEAFTEMNRDLGLSREVVEARAKSFRDRLARQHRLISAAWVKGWPSADARRGREPAFVLSFPRSGTTILDTLLMGHPAVRVTEEKPMLDAAARRVGGPERLAELSAEEIGELRKLYFDIAKAYVPDLDGQLLIDKQPFATVEAPLIHRLFPGARMVFAERHPCDVVLSCFVTRFEPNPATLNFTTLEGTARLYDQVMAFWSKCREVLPLDVHTVRYERLVADTEAELRPLLDFFGLGWTERMLDHESTASERGIVNTASYAQVAEPIYTRSIGRWEKYRAQMTPVLPILAPWAERMGYEI